MRYKDMFNTFDNVNPINNSIMKKFVIGLIFLGLASHMFAQDEESEVSFEEILLTGVTVSPIINGDYLEKVQEKVYSTLVLNLEDQVARYDISKSPIFKESAKGYKISFRQPNARIIARFDNTSTLLWTFEKFKDIACPENVRNTLFTEYGEWEMKSNTYFVHYSKDGELRRLYKIELKNGEKKQTVKLNSEGTQFEASENPALNEMVMN